MTQHNYIHCCVLFSICSSNIHVFSTVTSHLTATRCKSQQSASENEETLKRIFTVTSPNSEVLLLQEVTALHEQGFCNLVTVVVHLSVIVCQKPSDCGSLTQSKGTGASG